MIIEKIVLNNFQCYYGEVTLEFKEGINVIIGSNGYGKSKLYDAFYWVRYDRVFDSQLKQFITTEEAGAGLISDKAKFEKQNGPVSASVAITFYKDDGPRYTLLRNFEITVKDGIPVGPKKTEFFISKKEQTYLTAKLVTDAEEIERIFDRILPANIKDYLWFQGEQVESIIDFNQQDTLDKAINALSDIKRYDEIKRIAISAAKHGKTEFEKETKRYTNDSKSYEGYLDQKNEALAELATVEEDLTELQQNLTIAENKQQSIGAKLQDAQEIQRLQGQQSQMVENLKNLNQRLIDQQSKFHRKMFKNSWVLKGTERFAESFATLYEDYTSKKLKEEATENAKQEQIADLKAQIALRLPVDVPEPIHIKKMIEIERCLVCDREAKKGSQPYEKLMELLKRSESHTVSQSPKKSDLSIEFKKLYHNGLSLTKMIKSIDENINETLQSKDDIVKQIKIQSDEFDSVGQQIEKLLSINSLTSDATKNIVDTYTIQVTNAQTFRDKINLKEQKIATTKNHLEFIEDNLKKLVTNKMPDYLRNKYETLLDLERIAISTRDRVFNNLIQNLELEANKHYVEMTQGNKASRGKIKLQKRGHNYMPEIIDSEGNIMPGLNTSNLILVKLSAIMAIISAKTHSGKAYSLITDAPTSVFGEDYTIGFCKTISKVYKQSIVMSKEFYHNESLRNQLLTNPEIKLGRVYQITPSIVGQEERESRNGLETKIIEIK